MNSTQLITYIEEIASNILQKEYRDSKAYIVIDNVIFSFLEDENPFYVVTVRYAIKGVQKACEIDPVAGLSKNFFELTEIEAFAFAVYIANLIIKITDLITTEEIEEFIYQMLNKKNSSNIC